MNPTVGNFRTADGRFITLMLLQPGSLLRRPVPHLGLEHLLDDERFQDAEGLMAHTDEIGRQVADAIAASRSATGSSTLQTLEGPWSPAQNPLEVVARLTARGERLSPPGHRRRRPPPGPWWRTRCSSTSHPPAITRGPQFAEHTDDILRELGKTEDEILQLKLDGACT